MGNYNAPVQALESLSNRIGNIGQRRQAHQREMQNLGLSDARLGLERKMREGELGLKKAQFDREQFLNETVTGRQAIMTHPKLSDEQKAEFVDRVSKLPDGETILDALPFTRKQWAAGFRGAIQAAQGRQLQQNMARQKIEQQGRAGAGKDRRGTLGKTVDDIYNIRSQVDPNYTREQALDEAKAYSSDPRAAQMLLKVIEFADFNIEDESKRGEIMRQANDALNDIVKRSTGAVGGEDPGATKQLTREQAVEFMRKAGGDKEKAMQLARDEGYQF